MRNLTSSLRRSLWQITATVLMLGMANTALASDSTSDAVAAASPITVTKVRTVSELRAAIRAANLTTNQDVILLAEGTYAFAGIASAHLGPSVLPVITSAINIVGQGRDNTILDAQRNGRLFTIEGGRLVLRRLTLTRGAIDTAQSASGGGAALLVKGTLQIEHCAITKSGASAVSPGGNAAGGGILVTDGKLILEDVVLSNNTASIGGAVAINGSSLVAAIRHVIMNANVATGGKGGGFYVGKATARVTESTIKDNRAKADFNVVAESVGGGGIFNSGSLKIVRSAIVANLATPVGSGGGIFNAGTLVLQDSTLATNRAGTFGGGLHSSSPSFPEVIPRVTAILENVTLVQNKVLGNVSVSVCPFTPCTGGGGISQALFVSPAIRIKNTILAENRVPPTLNAFFSSDCDPIVTLQSQGHNIFGDRSCRFSGALGKFTEDLVGVAPLLGPLVDDGQSGHAYFAPLAGSPAIDGARFEPEPTGRPDVFIQPCSDPTDQLGRGRTDGDGDGRTVCDIGSIESAPFPGRAVTWTRQFGGAGFDQVSRLVEFEGFIYAMGARVTPATVSSPQQIHSFLRKYDLKGRLIWIRRVILEGTTFADIAVDDSGIYVCGESDQQGKPFAAFVNKYDLDGNELWSRRLSGDALIFAGFANSIALVEGDVFVAGEVAGVQEKAFAVRLTAEGVELWKTVVADSLDAGFGIGVHESRVYLQADDIFVLDSMGEVVERLATGPAGKLAVNEDGIFTSGSFLKRFDFDGHELWRQSPVTEGTLRIVDDALLVCGNIFPGSSARSAIQEFGVDGELRATRLFGVPGSRYYTCADLAVVDGGIVLGGFTGVLNSTTPVDAFLARMPPLTTVP